MNKTASLLSALLVVCATLDSASAAVVLNSSPNLVLSSDSQVVATPAEVPVVSSGTLLTYNAASSGGFLSGAYGAAQFNNGDVGVGVTGQNATISTDGVATGSFIFTFTSSARVIGSLGIYMGYPNRDDGTYTLSYTLGAITTTLGSYTITTPGAGSVDDFLLTLPTPVTADSLTLSFVSTDSSPSASVREVQIFQGVAVPEPSTTAMALAGLGLFLVFGQRRARWLRLS